MRFRILSSETRSILSQTSGFIAQAGFTHSLTPARNCTYGCTYCYVPTMRVHGGLKREDWEHWGQFTTFKENAAELLRRSLRGGERIYCSPLVDPYQPAEEESPHMPAILEALIARPPAVFALQTRGRAVLRDLPLLRRLPCVRVSFSITTNREEIRKLYEPHCLPNAERLEIVRALRRAGIGTYATLAPILPCDPELLASEAAEASGRDLIGDPLHVRQTKRCGATTRDAAARIAERHGHAQWFDPAFQATIVDRIRRVAGARGLRFGIGPEGFSWLAQT